MTTPADKIREFVKHGEEIREKASARPWRYDRIGDPCGIQRPDGSWVVRVSHDGLTIGMSSDDSAHAVDAVNSSATYAALVLELTGALETMDCECPDDDTCPVMCLRCFSLKRAAELIEKGKV